MHLIKKGTMKKAAAAMALAATLTTIPAMGIMRAPVTAMASNRQDCVLQSGTLESGLEYQIVDVNKLNSRSDNGVENWLEVMGGTAGKDDLCNMFKKTPANSWKCTFFYIYEPLYGNGISLESMCENGIYLANVFLDKLEASGITNMRSAFAGCYSLRRLELIGPDLSQVNDINDIFKGCTRLMYVDFGNINALNIPENTDIWGGQPSVNLEKAITKKGGIKKFLEGYRGIRFVKQEGTKYEYLLTTREIQKDENGKEVKKSNGEAEYVTETFIIDESEAEKPAEEQEKDLETKLAEDPETKPAEEPEKNPEVDPAQPQATSGAAITGDDKPKPEQPAIEKPSTEQPTAEKPSAGQPAADNGSGNQGNTQNGNNGTQTPIVIVLPAQTPSTTGQTSVQPQQTPSQTTVQPAVTPSTGTTTVPQTTVPQTTVIATDDVEDKLSSSDDPVRVSEDDDTDTSDSSDGSSYSTGIGSSYNDSSSRSNYASQSNYAAQRYTSAPKTSDATSVIPLILGLLLTLSSLFPTVRNRISTSQMKKEAGLKRAEAQIETDADVSTVAAETVSKDTGDTPKTQDKAKKNNSKKNDRKLI